VATTTSTWPFTMKDSRLAETVSVQVIPSSGIPSLAAMSLPISTSKPSGVLVVGLSRPNPGWSNLVPMVIFPASFSSAIVVPASNWTSVSTAALVPAASSAWLPASLEQPASTTPKAAKVAA
jgi:hypothetical protein